MSVGITNKLNKTQTIAQQEAPGTIAYAQINKEGSAVAQWLRCGATNRKVAGSIPAGVSEFFIDIKSFLGSTQPLTEMSTRSLSWG